MSTRDEQKAYEEYLRLVDTLVEMSGWSGVWEDTEIDGVKYTGDKKRFMKEWEDNQKIFDDTFLDEPFESYDDEYF